MYIYRNAFLWSKSLFHGLFYTQLHYLMPMALVALLPVLAIFFFAQRYVTRSIADTGLKG